MQNRDNAKFCDNCDGSNLAVFDSEAKARKQRQDLADQERRDVDRKAKEDELSLKSRISRSDPNEFVEALNTSSHPLRQISKVHGLVCSAGTSTSFTGIKNTYQDSYREALLGVKAQTVLLGGNGIVSLTLAVNTSSPSASISGSAPGSETIILLGTAVTFD